MPALAESRAERLRADEPSTSAVRWMPYRLLPYERRLGLRELERLGVEVVEDQDAAVVVQGDTGPILSRATYFDQVESGEGAVAETQQSRVERVHLERRRGNGTRQATRYGLHGVHEYKGKFNPQVVRALCNVVDPEAQLLVDPFCGSGTALLEGLRLGLDVLGVDRSPMAVFLASTKVDAATADDKVRLENQVLRLSRRVREALEQGQSRSRRVDLAPVLGPSATNYLRDWFTPPAFAALACALEVLHAASPSIARRLCLLALSSILRSVSLQMPEDLRIRRRPEPFEAPELAPLFAEAVGSIRQGLTEIATWGHPDRTAVVLRGSTDDPGAFVRARGRRRRLIVTSPPYATALPYIDTDRLSLLALGLAESAELMPLERQLMGSREWRRAEQGHWDERRATNADSLPSAITQLLDHIELRNMEGGAGFRRLALPSLLYRYFAGMADAMSNWRRVLQPGESAVLIVGHNRTTAAGERIDIATPSLLGEAAISRGFDVPQLLPLDAWPRYGLHSANGVPGEDALVIKRPS